MQTPTTFGLDQARVDYEDGYEAGYRAAINELQSHVETLYAKAVENEKIAAVPRERGEQAGRVSLLSSLMNRLDRMPRHADDLDYDDTYKS
jgi:hypothetical protein